MKKLISSGSDFENQYAYSRAVIDGHYVFVSGTTGYDYQSMSISEDVAEQTEQCFQNIKQASANCELDDAMKVEIEVTARLK